MQLKFSDEVAAALAEKRPVVALESTIIAHGFPWPDNLEIGRGLENAVRDHGAVPATIAILEGDVHVGLEDADLIRLAEGGRVIAKCSVRDLPVVIGRRGDGATTVAATARIAHMAGIALFATGGIGGVHRPALPGGVSHDVSADLYEMARTPIAIVSAGAKSILDLPATVELLETLGITVLGYGTDCFPAFFSRESDLPVMIRCDAVQEVAAMIAARDDLGLPGAVLICNPPPEEAAIPAHDAEIWLEQALRQAREEGIGGAATTPFLLARLRDLSQGRTIDVNKALALANARLAAEVAKALSSSGGLTDGG